MSAGASIFVHPAAGLIGEPWTPERNCWWLVREYFARCRGLALPELADLGAALRASRWRRADDAPRADDIVLMRAPLDARHVGVMLAADARLWVLHCDGGPLPGGARCWGGVVWQPQELLIGAGYRDFEFWRLGDAAEAGAA
jgi:hypothetical protein